MCSANYAPDRSPHISSRDPYLHEIIYLDFLASQLHPLMLGGGHAQMRKCVRVKL